MKQAIEAKEIVLVEQYTEKDYSLEQLAQICTEKVKTCKKDGIMIEFINHKPVLNEKGEVIGVRTDFPAELNVYAYKTPVVFDIFDKENPTPRGYMRGTGRSFSHIYEIIKKENR